MISHSDDKRRLKFFLPFENLLASNSDDENEAKGKKCTKCMKFVSEKEYQRHMDAHSFKKPYCCEEADCIKRFNSSANLKLHMKSEHSKISEKEYSRVLKEIKKCLSSDQNLTEETNVIKDNEIEVKYKVRHLGDYGKNQRYISCTETVMKEDGQCNNRYIECYIEKGVPE